MSKNWIPLQVAMATYCEPYFQALSRWKDYKDKDLIENRLQVTITLCEVLKEWVFRSESYEFTISSENLSDLYPETIPKAGLTFQEGNDKLAFASAKELINERLFQSGGWYFQNGLLKALAGWDEESLTKANNETRNSAIDCVRWLFRVSEEAGKVFLCYHVLPKNGDVVVNLPLANLNESATKLLGHITTYQEQQGLISSSIVSTDSAIDADDRPVLKSSSSSVDKRKRNTKRESSSRKKLKHDEVEAEADLTLEEVKWTTSHESVGVKIAKLFPGSNGKKELFHGTVTKYAPPSKAGADDQLYHIVYVDGDEEDFNESEFAKYRKKFLKDSILWTDNHFSIGTKVGKFEYIDLTNEYNESETKTSEEPKKTKKSKVTKQKVFVPGKVTRYAIGRIGVEQIYFISWDDGEEQELTEKQYRFARELFTQETSTDGNNLETSSSSSATVVPETTEILKPVEGSIVATEEM